jgi:hypothetical protein
MNDGLNIRKISPPIFGASKVRATKRENRDSRKNPFQRHFQDEKENKSEDGSTSGTGKIQQELESKTGKGDSDGGKIQESLHKDLGKRIDIHV